MRSDTIVLSAKCTRMASLLAEYAYTKYPESVIKIALQELATKKGSTVDKVIKKLQPYMEEYPGMLENLTAMAEYIYRYRKSIISIDAEIPFSIGPYPLTVYVPFILKRPNVIALVWLDFSNRAWTLTDVLEDPAVLSIYLCSKREGYMDKTTKYQTIIVSGRYLHRIERRQNLREICETQLLGYVKGVVNEKETPKAGTHCIECTARTNCKLNPQRIANLIEGEIFSVSDRHNGQPFKTNGQGPKGGDVGQVRRHSDNIRPLY